MRRRHRTSQKQDKKCLWIAAIPAFLFVLYCILDYLNVPQLLGISVRRINMDLFSVFLNTAVVVILYIITYYFVDKRQIQKDANAKSTANILLLNTYQECLTNLRIVANTEILRKYIVPKIDFNDTIKQEGVLSNLQNFPFQFKDKILELAEAGYVERETLENYFHIQKEHRELIYMKITFFDLTNPQTSEQIELCSEIDRQYKELKLLLNQEIKKLSQYKNL